MFLEIEQNGPNRRLINVTLADKVMLNEHTKTATLFTGTVPLASDSKMLYDFFSNRPDDLVTTMPEKVAPVQSGAVTPPGA